MLYNYIGDSMLEEIRNKLLEMQDLEYRKFHTNLVNNVDNIIGIRVPILRNIAKELLKEDYLSYIKAPKEYYEEIMIEGILIVTSKLDILEKEKYLKTFLPKVNNWAICDSVSSSFKIKKQEKEEVWKFITSYKNSSKEFEVRFMLDMMMDHYLDDEYYLDIIAIVSFIKSDYYYVNMGLAWLISFLYIKYPNNILDLFKNNKLDKFVHNKAIQKICESNRVNSECKESLKKLKK